MSTRMIIAIRHGQFALNLRSELTGKAALLAVEEGVPANAHDVLGLFPSGRKQARALQSVLRQFHITSVLSSPTLRTRQTAAIALQGHPFSGNILNEPNLAERNRGKFSYAPNEWARSQPDYWLGKKSILKWRPTDGESLEDIRSSALMVLRRCHRLGRTTLLSTHAEKMVLLRSAWLGLDDEGIVQFPILNGVPGQASWHVRNGQADCYAFGNPADPTSKLSEKPQFFRTIIDNYDSGWLKIH